MDASPEQFAGISKSVPDVMNTVKRMLENPRGGMSSFSKTLFESLERVSPTE